MIKRYKNKYLSGVFSLVLALSAAHFLTACGGGNGSGLVAPAIDDASLQSYPVNTAISALSFVNSGGSSLTSCTADSLPIGLSVAISADSTTCAVTGIPTVPQAVTTHTITATNARGSDTAAVSIAVIALTAADKLAAGGPTCVGFNDGKLKCWGPTREYKAIGLEMAPPTLGDEPNEMGDNLPVLNLGSGLTVAQLSSGSSFTCARMTTGQVKCWGDNTEAQLGSDTLSQTGDEPNEMGDVLPFVALGANRSALAIASGGTHSCALLDDGTVKCWGYNNNGELGLGDREHRGDDPNEMGDNLPAVDLGTGRTAISIAAGSEHSCAILDNASVKCWGHGTSGELGQGNSSGKGDDINEMGDNLPAIDLGTGRTALAIAAGERHTCALLDDNTVKCWGNNNYGVLGVVGNFPLGDGANEMGDNLPAVDLGTGRTAQAIVTGAIHSCALLDNSSVKCWGYNGGGQLGLGDISSRGSNAGEMGDNLPVIELGTGRTAVAIQTGGYFTCAILDNLSAKCWGSNSAGVLGQGDTQHRGDNANEMGDNLPVISLGTGRSVQSLTGGNSHSCALLNDNSVKCWGGNSVGQLGTGNGLLPGDEPGEMGANLPYINVGATSTVKAVSVGTHHACAILHNDTVKCWGENWNGQLGLGHVATLGEKPGEMGDNLATVDLGLGRTAKQIVVGSTYSCARLDDNTVKCWGGDNGSGQLGLGDTSDRGGNANEMGDNLPVIDLGTGRTALAITAGENHVCAMLDDNTLKCWGNNSRGQLGLGNTQSRGDNVNEMGDSLPVIDLGTGRSALAISAGTQYTCALLDNYSVKCWGHNSVGQLGVGDSQSRGDDTDEMGDNLPAIDLGMGRTALAITTGERHTCVLLDTNNVKCWGYNSSGELGLEHTGQRGTNPSFMGDNLLAVDLGTGRTAKIIQAGHTHTCALLDNDSVKCWGNNLLGTLGIGSTKNKGDEPGEMGDNLPAVNLLN